MVRWFVVLGLLVAAQTLRAQWYSPLSLEYRFGKLTAATHAPNIVNNNLGAGDGTSAEHWVAMDYTAVSLPLFRDAIALNGDIALSQSFGSFSSSDGSFSLAYSATALRAMPEVELLLNSISIGIAPWLDIPIARTLTESPATSNILFSNFPYGLRAELGARRPLVDGLPILIRAFGEFDLDAYRQPQLTFGDCVSAGVGLQWYFDRSSPSVAVPGSVPIVQPRADRVSASAQNTVRAQLQFTAHGKPIARGESVPIEAHDTLIRQWVMLPRFVLLSSDGRSLADHYVRLTPAQAKSFTIDSLTRLNEVDIAKNLLNVLGSRMTKVTDASITLGGPSPAIDTVMQYLGSRFRIARQRFRLDRNHADRIWIEPTPLLAPVATQWIERSYDLSNIGIEHHVDGPYASWQIELREGSETSQYASNMTQDPKLILRRISAHDSSLIVATLTAVDSNGRATVAQDTLHIVQGASSQQTVETDRFVFLADRFNREPIANLEQLIRERKWKHAMVGEDDQANSLDPDINALLQHDTEHLAKLNIVETTGPRAVVVLQQ